METISLEARVDAMDKKLDIILEYVHQQKLSTDTIEDLISDVSIVGTEVYHNTVEELEKRQIELDLAELTNLGVGIIRNIKNFNMLLSTLESAIDLTKDLSPILNDTIVDVIKKADELDRKGYFEFFKESGQIVDNIVTGFEVEDVRMLADNIVMILSTIKDITQPKMLKSITNAVKVFASIETDEIPEISVWQLIRTLNSPEVKKGLGFIITFMKNISEKIEQKD